MDIQQFLYGGVKRHKYPIEVFNFNGEIRVIRTKKSYAHLLGMKLISIDNVSIEKIIDETSAIAAFVENEYSKMERTSSYMMTSELLHAIGIVNDIAGAEFTFKDDENKLEKIQIKSVPVSEYDNLEYEEIKLNFPNLTRPKEAKLAQLWFKNLINKNIVYVKFGRYPDYNQMEFFSEELLNFINCNQIQNIIIDLRDNYGGDFYIGLRLARYLNLADSIDWKNGVYVLTNRKTFSAASSNTAQFRQLLNAKIVGEVTGGNPVGYQDMDSFKLPHSNLLITYSKRLFRMQDVSSDGVQPDKPIAPNWQDYKNGIDNVLDWVLKDINP